MVFNYVCHQMIRVSQQGIKKVTHAGEDCSSDQVTNYYRDNVCFNRKSPEIICPLRIYTHISLSRREFSRL